MALKDITNVLNTDPNYHSNRLDILEWYVIFTITYYKLIPTHSSG